MEALAVQQQKPKPKAAKPAPAPQRPRLTLADLKPALAARQAEQHPSPESHAGATPVPPAKKQRTPAQQAKRRRQRQAQAARRAPKAAVEALTAELARRFPRVFGLQRKPLAIGVHRQIAVAMDCDKHVLSTALHLWCAHSAYLTALAHGTHRFALNGEIASAVLAPEREAAKARAQAAMAALRDRGFRVMAPSGKGHVMLRPT